MPERQKKTVEGDLEKTGVLWRRRHGYPFPVSVGAYNPRNSWITTYNPGSSKESVWMGAFAVTIGAPSTTVTTNTSTVSDISGSETYTSGTASLLIKLAP